MTVDTRLSPLQLLWIGRSESREMLPVVDAISLLIPAVNITRVTNVSEGVRATGDHDAHPDLVVICQQWPDEYPPSDVDRLIAAFPLARFICCYDAWCESDGRNRDIWPPAVRVPVSMFEHRLRSEIEILRGTCFPLPLTASRDEAFAFNFSPECRGGSVRLNGVGDTRKSLNIRIHTPDRELERWLSDLLASAGHKPSVRTALLADSPADVILWDLDPWDAGRLERELRITGCSGDQAAVTPKIVGLMGLIYPEDAAVAQSLGVCSILSKLAPLNDFLAAVAGPIAA